MMTSILIDSDPSQKRWIEIARDYLPGDVLEEHGGNLAIVSLGGMGACRLTKQYRVREIVFLSDWIFPPPGASEGDEAGRFFIGTVLHEISHAVCRHLSPSLDGLTAEQNQAQEDEADSMAINWFNDHVQLGQNEHLKPMDENCLRDLVEQFSKIYDKFENSKAAWHEAIGT